MSKTFTVPERMPCSHTTVPLAMIPAELMKLCVPRRTPLVKPLLTAHIPHQERRTTGHGSFHSHMVLHCVLLCEWEDKPEQLTATLFSGFGQHSRSMEVSARSETACKGSKSVVIQRAIRDRTRYDTSECTSRGVTIPNWSFKIT